MKKERSLRDLGSFIAEAQARMEEVQIPPGYWTTWGGTKVNTCSTKVPSRN